MGRYAIRIQWSDGHSTGIYTFQKPPGVVPLRGLRGQALTSIRFAAAPGVRGMAVKA